MRQLVRAGVRKVLGWDGSVYDTDAMAFARHFYRELSQGHHGVLVLGMGNLGKSSVAARIRDRLVPHRPAVLFGRFDALALLDKLLDLVPPQERAALKQTWRPLVIDQPGTLADAREALLTGAFAAAPVLLILDDLEQALEAPTAQDEVLARVQPNIATPLRPCWASSRGSRPSRGCFAAERFGRIAAERELAIVRGQIADILQARGDVDEALRI